MSCILKSEMRSTLATRVFLKLQEDFESLKFGPLTTKKWANGPIQLRFPPPEFFTDMWIETYEKDDFQAPKVL